ncbi:MAG: SUMF1/EgtB/PvdO family nonheme iron enzyme [Sedimentisphaerales bacterium]|nr:SUMF1/EgtB/PvdO family nonheme iron enzyme [Sedimentisphaerales bacterium]
MARFGQYETDRPLDRAGFNAIYLCQAGTKGSGRRVIKAYEPSARVRDERLAAAESAAFLDSAAIQQRAASEDPRHWAPIHESGTSPQGAFYVTDYYDLSAQQLIRDRVSVGAAGLYRIVESVTKGLLALKRACGRPHGNLKPANILITRRRALTGQRVVLSDPCPGSLLDEDTHAKADMVQIGALIHQLVMHRDPPLVAGYQVPDSPQWRRLGRRAKAWRALCNRLLTMDVQTEPLTLEELAARLPRIARRAEDLAIKAAACVGAVVLLAVLSRLAAGWIGDLLAPPDPNEAYQQCWEAQKWLGPLPDQLNESIPGHKKRYDYWKADQELDKLAKLADNEYGDFLRKKEPGDTNAPPERLTTKRGYRNTVVTANKARIKIEGILSTWAVPERLAEDANSLRGKKCESMPTYVDGLLRSIRHHEEQLAEHIDAVLYLKDHWHPVQYEKLEPNAIEKDPNLIPPVQNAKDFVERLETLPNHYKQDIPDFDDLVASERQLRKKLNDVNDVNDSGDEEARGLLAELDAKVAPRINEIKSIPFTRANAKRVTQECAIVQERVLAIDRQIRDAGQWFDLWHAEGESGISSSRAINEAFRARLDAWTGGDRDAFVARHEGRWTDLRNLRNKVNQTRNNLRRLDASLPPTLVKEPATKAWIQEISQYYEREMRDRLIRIIEELAQGKSAPDPNGYPPECKQWLDWPNRAIVLIDDFNAIEEGLDHFHLLDENLRGTPDRESMTIRFLWGKYDPRDPNNVLKDTSVGRIVSPITDRLDELRYILDEISDSNSLFREAAAPQFDAKYGVWQTRYAVWHKLASLNLSKREWRAEESIRNQLMGELESRRRDGRLPKTRWDELVPEIEHRGKERERQFWNIGIDDLANLVARRTEGTRAASLLRLGDFKPGDNVDLLKVKAYHECLRKLLDDDVNSADWPGAYDLGQFGKDFPPQADTDTVINRLSEMRLYRRIGDPRDEPAWKDSRDELVERIEEGRSTMKDNKAVMVELDRKMDALERLDQEFGRITSLAAIEKHKRAIGEWSRLLGDLQKEQQRVNSIVHPAYRHLTFRRDGTAVFRTGLGLDQFEPIGPDGVPLKGTPPDDSLFTKTDRRDKRNAGWPTYIRARKDPRVILRFVPHEKDSDPHPFYMAIREITSAQFVKFIGTIAKPEDRLKYLDDVGTSEFYSSGINVTNAWINSRVPAGGKYLDSMPDRPVVWVTYAGAQAYAEWLTAIPGKGLPKTPWHERAALYSHPSNREGLCKDPTLYHIRTRQYWDVMQAWKDSQPKTDRRDLADWMEAYETARKAEVAGVKKPVGAVPEEPDDPSGPLENGIYTEVYPMATKTQELPDLKLYDLLGNVWEWCAEDPSGKPVICGGSCLSPLKYINPSARYDRPNGDPACDLGFRVAVQCPQPESVPSP